MEGAFHLAGPGGTGGRGTGDGAGKRDGDRMVMGMRDREWGREKTGTGMGERGRGQRRGWCRGWGQGTVPKSEPGRGLRLGLGRERVEIAPGHDTTPGHDNTTGTAVTTAVTTVVGAGGRTGDTTGWRRLNMIVKSA